MSWFIFLSALIILLSFRESEGGVYGCSKDPHENEKIKATKVEELKRKLSNTFSDQKKSLNKFFEFVDMFKFSDFSQPVSSIIFGDESFGIYNFLADFIDTTGYNPPIYIDLFHYIDENASKGKALIKKKLGEYLMECEVSPIIVVDHLEKLKGEKIVLLDNFLEIMSERPHFKYNDDVIEPTNMILFMIFHDNDSSRWNQDWQAQLQQFLNYESFEFTPSALIGRLTEAIVFENHRAQNFLLQHSFSKMMNNYTLASHSSFYLFALLLVLVILFLILMLSNQKAQKVPGVEQSTKKVQGQQTIHEAPIPEHETPLKLSETDKSNENEIVTPPHPTVATFPVKRAREKKENHAEPLRRSTRIRDKAAKKTL